jgi:site-specific DNA-methyltransferase (cytosine-N4-specific)
MYCGHAERVLKTQPLRRSLGKAQLIFTSPPFPLKTQKRYGNLEGEPPHISFALEVGNAWEAGRPVMSTVVLRALLRFLEWGGLNLCQEFIWYNNARLPAPAQWVNVERIRVKDAFTRVWWMSPTERPKADNRKVLREYSHDMKLILQTGKYNAGIRPPEYHIREQTFNKDNGGAIVPNVIEGDDVPALGSILKATNTRSSGDQYQLFCRGRDVHLHPARMPRELVEFFLRFLTDEGDLVIDPFAGSNTTGAIAEAYGRPWLSVEAQWYHAAHSIGRFSPDSIAATCNALNVEKVIVDDDSSRYAIA